MCGTVVSFASCYARGGQCFFAVVVELVIAARSQWPWLVEVSYNGDQELIVSFGSWCSFVHCVAPARVLSGGSRTAVGWWCMTGGTSWSAYYESLTAAYYAASPHSVHRFSCLRGEHPPTHPAYYAGRACEQGVYACVCVCVVRDARGQLCGRWFLRRTTSPMVLPPRGVAVASTVAPPRCQWYYLLVVSLSPLPSLPPLPLLRVLRCTCVVACPTSRLLYLQVFCFFLCLTSSFALRCSAASVAAAGR